MKQGVVVNQAECCYQAIYGFPHSVTVRAKLAIVLRGGHGQMLST
jgi:hypothetical protein